MFDFHQDKSVYFQYQYITAKDHIIPFIEGSVTLKKEHKILEIGCAEAGVLKAFLERGHTCIGIELMPGRVKLARSFLQDDIHAGRAQIITRDIYDIDPAEDLDFRFDLIILKDVIEHIHDQDRFIGTLRQFLNPGGVVFLGFPPWHMPFGGHQQICTNKWLSKIPYYHLLPEPLYRWILSKGGEKDSTIKGLLEIKETGISIERFEKIVHRHGFNILQVTLFLINPIYKYKFGLEPRVQLPLIRKLPGLRNLFSTCAYYLIN